MIIYSQNGLTVFQNKVYPTIHSAKKAIIGNVELVQSEHTGLVYNHLFDSNLLSYDSNYENEQGCSIAFQKHLNEVMQIILSHCDSSKKIVEIGCGKGRFFDMLREHGLDVFGYDPAYKGSDSRIKKEYFGQNMDPIAPDFIVLRHVLEHIQNPWSFLKLLSTKANSGAQIYIEVPNFEWIIEKQAFYDIFYEHVNYFSAEVLKNAFKDILNSGVFFGGQYFYIVAKLHDFITPVCYSGKKYGSLIADHKIDSLMEKRVYKQKAPYVWGAGAKGVTFSNKCMQNGIKIEKIIDINPNKQNKYIGLSAVRVVSYEEVDLTNSDIFVMNPMYIEEIKNICNCIGTNFICIE